MNGLFKFGVKKIGEFAAKKGLSEIDERVDNFFKNSSLNPFSAKELNKGEDERMKKYNLMNKNPQDWTMEELDEIMQSKEYQYDNITQQKVKKYFDTKYPGNAKKDATGRLIN